MADISAEIAAFKSAVYGEDVRTAMVNLANKVNNESSAAATTVGKYDTRISAVEADGYVNTAKLANGSVTDAKLAQSGGVLDEVSGLESTVNMLEDNRLLLSKSFERGSINGSGAFVPVASASGYKNRISSNDITKFDFDVNVIVEEGYQCYISLYTSGEHPLPANFIRTIIHSGPTSFRMAKNTLFVPTIIPTPEDTSVYADVSLFKTKGFAVNSITDDIENMQILTDKNIIPFEVGGMTLTNGNKLLYYYDGRRIITKKGFLIELFEGDIVGLTDYTKASIGMYKVNNDGTAVWIPWKNSDYTVETNGYYAFIIRNNPDRSQNFNPNLLQSLFKIKTKFRANSIANTILNYNNQLIGTFNIKGIETVKSINHKGSHFAPEDTIAAYILSKKAGFNYVETDIRFTADNPPIPVLLHDADINRVARLSDGSAIPSTINIDSITYAEALTYDFGIAFSNEYAGTKIATLEELVRLCKFVGLHPYLEIKAGATETEVTICYNIVKSYGMERHVSWLSAGTNELNFIKNLDSKARLGIVSSTVTETLISNALALKTTTNEVFIDSGSYGDDAVNLCKEAGLPLEAWVVNDENTIKNANPYISGWTSDYTIAAKVLYNSMM